MPRMQWGQLCALILTLPRCASSSYYVCVSGLALLLACRENALLVAIHAPGVYFSPWEAVRVDTYVDTRFHVWVVPITPCFSQTMTCNVPKGCCRFFGAGTVTALSAWQSETLSGARRVSVPAASSV